MPTRHVPRMALLCASGPWSSVRFEKETPRCLQHAGPYASSGACDGQCCPADEECTSDYVVGGFGCCPEGVVLCNGVCCHVGSNCGSFTNQCEAYCESSCQGNSICRIHRVQ